MNYQLSVGSIDEASRRLVGVVAQTPLQFSPRLSQATGARIYLKREDLQAVRSYKIRGAYNLIGSLDASERRRGVVCASAGNHAQGVAFSCSRWRAKGVIFMPVNTPPQKINRVRHFGGRWVKLRIVGNNFDEASALAAAFAKKTGTVFVHPFDDNRVMSGQGTVGKEIVHELGGLLDVVVCPIGGGGLIAGAGTYLKAANASVRLVGVEAEGAAGMHESLKRGRVVTLPSLDRFVDGTAVATVGRRTFAVAKKLVDGVAVVAPGLVCSTMIDLYQNEGIVAEPAGALAVAALAALKNLRGKTVVCIVSGGNNDIMRYPEILERSLVHQGLKHYLLIEFAQKPGQLKLLINKALGDGDDIVRFEYLKKNSKETGPGAGRDRVGKKREFCAPHRPTQKIPNEFSRDLSKRPAHRLHDLKK